jgi:putative proteasome-type protease
MMVLMTAGNLSISQSIRQTVAEFLSADGTSIWSASSMYEAAQIVGDAIRTVHKRDAKSLEQFGIDFNVSMIFGGQIKGERCRLFQMYAAGNFIESHDENPYFQIGEAKYGKPIIDRVITPTTPLDEAAKCALVSMDSTLRSNISVGFPLDLLVYEKDALSVGRFVTVDERNQYFQMIRSTWGQQLKTVFEGIPDPVWNAALNTEANVLSSAANHNQPVRVQPPTTVAKVEAKATQLQTLAQQDQRGQPQ